MLCLIMSSTGVATASAQTQEHTVRIGALGFVFFPDDFSSAKRHPLTFDAYLPAGEGNLTAVFISFLGTGTVTVTVSSGAFLIETSISKQIKAEFQLVQFSFPYTVRPDVDGSFGVWVLAKNEEGTQLDFWFPDIRVWSRPHIEAADQLFLAERLVTSFPTSVQSVEARTLILEAQTKHASATSSFFAKDWTKALEDANETIKLLRQANQAENSFTQSLREKESARAEMDLAIKERANSLEQMRVGFEQRRAVLEEQRFQLEARENLASTITLYLASASLVFGIVGASYLIFRLTRRAPKP